MNTMLVFAALLFVLSLYVVYNKREAYKALAMDEIPAVAFTPTTPSINGVSIIGFNKNFLVSSVNSGMITPQYAAEQLGKGNNAPYYGAQQEVLQNTLELDPTQEMQRYKVASVISDYIPKGGVPMNSGYWVQRNYVGNLQQPGFDGGEFPAGVSPQERKEFAKDFFPLV